MADRTPDHDATDTITSPLARRFVEALEVIDERGRIDDMVALAGNDTRWWSTGPDHDRVGRDGAERFWTAYRQAFAEIRSEFSAVTETRDRIVLEWRSHGRHHDGTPVRYSGVTVLDLAETADGSNLTAVRLYFDTAATLVPAPTPTSDDGADAGMLDRETAASGRNSGLAPDG